MNYLKEGFKKCKRSLELMSKSKLFTEYDKGYLKALKDYENLILFGVGSSKREDTLKNFKEMNEDFLEGIINDYDNKHDPMEELNKKLCEKYVVIKKY